MVSKIKERLSQWASQASTWLQEQTWYQQLKGKWEELDPQARMNVQKTTVFISSFFAIIMVLSIITSVYNERRTVHEKLALLNELKSATQEIRNLKSSGLEAEAMKSNWSDFFQGTAGKAGLDPTVVQVSPEKRIQSPPDAQESIFQIELKHINVKQLIRYAYTLENNSRPVKLRSLNVEALDPLGYLNAKLSVSAFTLLN